MLLINYKTTKCHSSLIPTFSGSVMEGKAWPSLVMKAVFNDEDVMVSSAKGDLCDKKLVTVLLDKTLEAGIASASRSISLLTKGSK
jgi:hypothetical protein